MTGSEIRNTFLSFFQNKDHTIVKSSSLIPASDPTLLFTNAGMVPFKDVFLGREKRNYQRATSSQKCVRAGGKHNDLEVVGTTDRHHTFFEMLGNFSFGDYFKEKAIEYAWEFLTKTLSIPKEKLLITIYLDDDESYEIWNRQLGLPDERIIRLGDKDNFWSMGDTGPCVPCSEIIFDRVEGTGCGRPECKVECECDRHLEIWNLVFMQFDRNKSGELTPLPQPNIDTGMGLERITSVVQNVDGNFETDLLRPIIGEVEKISTRRYGDNDSLTFSFRVIADHSRAAAFMIGDGILPSNEGRGYVLRRIIRRAIRHGKLLGLDKAFLYLVSEKVADIMGQSYPELTEKKEFTRKIIQNEEERFGATLEHGLCLLEELMNTETAKDSNTLSGVDLFKLYDTYGFPLDLTREIAQEKGFTLDIDGFNRSMNNQKKMARASWKGAQEGEDKNKYAQLVSGFPPTVFTGYENMETEANVIVIVQKGEPVEGLSEGEEGELICDQSPFYGESGGQIGDTGTARNENCSLTVLEAQKPLPGHIIHKIKVMSGTVRKGDPIYLRVNRIKRNATELNHSATHLLHKALREIMGDHIKQAGSAVDSDRLRFDYTHFSAPEKKDVRKVEALVNEMVMDNLAVETETMSFDEAVQTGAVALFGEKYGDEVRVVKMGDFSMELCGGTHTSATGKIGFFKITHEGGIAAGVRRIEAVTGMVAYSHISEQEDRLNRVRDLLKSAPGEEEEKLRKTLQKTKELDKELQKAREKLISSDTGDIGESVKHIQDIKVIAKRLEGADIKALRAFVDSAKVKIKSGVVVSGCIIDEKVALVVGLTKDLTNRLHSGKITGKIAPIVKGKGGGRADMAQAGGPDQSKLDEALEKSYSIITDML